MSNDKLLTEEDYEEAAARLGCEVAAIKAVAEVESSGGGFNSDGSPKILFEGHIFSKYTNGRYDKSNPTISYTKWTKAYYRKNNIDEHKRLQQAIELDRNAALMATSWGKFQIMGFNYKACGFDDLQKFINAMFRSEGDQLLAFCGFILTNKLDDELRELRWADFARRYNGPAYAENKYDVKLARAYEKFSSY